VFAPADTWVSTESLFRRDADGDFWLVGNRNQVIRTDRGAVYAEPITDAISMIDAVDLAVTYRVSARGRQLAVTAVSLRPGATITPADLGDAVDDLAVGLPPDLIHVVRELPLSTVYRPESAALRAAGVPKPGRQSWYRDAETGRYERLTAAVRAALVDEN
jgi:putative long chain acyl-CoA synthase